MELQGNRAETKKRVVSLGTAECLRIRRFRPGYITRLKLHVCSGKLGRRRRDRGDGGCAEARTLVVQIADYLAELYTSRGVGGVESDVVSCGEAGVPEGPNCVGLEPKSDVGLGSRWRSDERGGPDECWKGSGCVGCA